MRWVVKAEETSVHNYSITYFNGSNDNIILDSEGNACAIATIPSIESTFENYYIHILYDVQNQYIYGYLI